MIGTTGTRQYDRDHFLQYSLPWMTAGVIPTLAVAVPWRCCAYFRVRVGWRLVKSIARELLEYKGG